MLIYLVVAFLIACLLGAVFENKRSVWVSVLNFSTALLYPVLMIAVAYYEKWGLTTNAVFCAVALMFTFSDLKDGLLRLQLIRDGKPIRVGWRCSEKLRIRKPKVKIMVNNSLSCPKCGAPPSEQDIPWDTGALYCKRCGVFIRMLDSDLKTD